MAVIQITAISLQGEGLGRLEGKIVFVPFTLPGESVEIEIKEDRKTYSRGRLVRVLEPSPDRVTPPCPVFGSCGGCHLQHASPSAQSRIKENGFREAFRHALKMDDLPNPNPSGFPRVALLSPSSAVENPGSRPTNRPWAFIRPEATNWLRWSGVSWPIPRSTASWPAFPGWSGIFLFWANPRNWKSNVSRRGKRAWSSSG